MTETFIFGLMMVTYFLTYRAGYKDGQKHPHLD